MTFLLLIHPSPPPPPPTAEFPVPPAPPPTQTTQIDVTPAGAVQLYVPGAVHDTCPTAGKAVPPVNSCAYVGDTSYEYCACCAAPGSIPLLGLYNVSVQQRILALLEPIVELEIY